MNDYIQKTANKKLNKNVVNQVRPDVNLDCKQPNNKINVKEVVVPEFNSSTLKDHKSQPISKEKLPDIQVNSNRGSFDVKELLGSFEFQSTMRSGARRIHKLDQHVQAEESVVD